ncbi:RNA-directed DNA polymerase, eukaryota, reverse transcriptase zinc-binding domain protein [Tanacetum coccineum]
MRNLKIHLRKLNWQNGNLFDKVEEVRDELKNVQKQIEKDPHNKVLRSAEVKILKEYMTIMENEEKLLFQKSKIKWLSLGNRNNSFFHKTLKGRHQKNRIEKIQDVNGKTFEGQDNRISDDEALFLVEDVSYREIKDALFDIGDNKAPGPDGYSSIFFKKRGKLLELISAKQLKSSSILGRQIQDYILLTQELLKGYDRKGGPNRVACKIDIQKAYDTVNWSFLETILTHFGFPKRMINWIMICVKTTSFTINVNGENCGFFQGGRGLRQGDPMSPYLFTLVMECFTLMMERNLQRNPNFQFYFGCKSIKITHVCFADDLLVLCHGDTDSIKAVKDSIDEFSGCSGLLPNF